MGGGEGGKKNHGKDERVLPRMLDYTQSSKIDNLKMSTTSIVLGNTRKVKMNNDVTSKTRVYNSPLYRGLRLWDSLPENIQKETDKASFKKRIATNLL